MLGAVARVTLDQESAVSRSWDVHLASAAVLIAAIGTLLALLMIIGGLVGAVTGG